jgi:hypothetical protein
MSSFSDLASRVSEFTLSNGLHFLVMERHEAPVVSCMMHANVGAFDEEDGSTGERRFGQPYFLSLSFMEEVLNYAIYLSSTGLAHLLEVSLGQNGLPD